MFEGWKVRFRLSIVAPIPGCVSYPRFELRVDLEHLPVVALVTLCNAEQRSNRRTEVEFALPEAHDAAGRHANCRLYGAVEIEA